MLLFSERPWWASTDGTSRPLSLPFVVLNNREDNQVIVDSRRPIKLGLASVEIHTAEETIFLPSLTDLRLDGKLLLSLETHTKYLFSPTLGFSIDYFTPRPGLFPLLASIQGNECAWRHDHGKTTANVLFISQLRSKPATMQPPLQHQDHS